MVRHLVKILSLLLILIACPSDAHAFVHQCESVGVTFDEFRVKNLPRDSSNYCEISAVIRLINCTNKFKKISVRVQGIDSEGFALDYFYLAGRHELDGYNHRKISETHMLECNTLRRINTWQAEIKAY
ncbi:MAG: hypothetical protein HW380_2961 [Magnetococcales bacterium]|nr:hypothetical protein [Magnetococcales bacterium]